MIDKCLSEVISNNFFHSSNQPPQHTHPPLSLPVRTAPVLSSPRPTSQSPSPSTALWTSPSSTTPASSGWLSRSPRRQTSLPSNRQETSRGRSTWSCCQPRSSGPRLAYRRGRVPSSRRHSSFPGWNRRLWGITLFDSACTASGAWRKRRSWEKRCSTWLSSTCRARSLYLSPWSPALNLQWGHFVNSDFALWTLGNTTLGWQWTFINSVSTLFISFTTNI